MSRLDLIVGPNGAGKSTFVEFVLADRRPNVVFVNADIIAAERWPDDPESHGHEAAAAAEQIRNELLTRRVSFIAETVGSHPSKVELVRRAVEAGYHVHLLVMTVPEELSVARVQQRVSTGGHSVPDERIRARYHRLWGNVVDMIELANSAEVFDNSGVGPTTIATFILGDPVGSPRWPSWTPDALSNRWPAVNH